jgi:hypothetical protein
MDYSNNNPTMMAGNESYTVIEKNRIVYNTAMAGGVGAIIGLAISLNKKKTTQQVIGYSITGFLLGTVVFLGIVMISDATNVANK